MADVIQTVHTAVEPLASEKGIELRTEVATDLPMGYGDDRRLVQVILNLVGNAIKFTDRGEVVISSQLSTISDQPSAISHQSSAVSSQSSAIRDRQTADGRHPTTESRFLVTVRDTGPGISAEQQEKIFEEFQQADTSSTREKGGTGLGLSIARRIVELHGGRIWVESEEGPGIDIRVRDPGAYGLPIVSALSAPKSLVARGLVPCAWGYLDAKRGCLTGLPSSPWGGGALGTGDKPPCYEDCHDR